jgi:hypothetical protein
MIKKLLPLLLAGLAAQAAPILLNSQAGLTTSTAALTVAITPHPLWQPNGPVNPGDPSDTSAIWISYKQSGFNEAEFQPFLGSTPVISVFHSFVSGAGNLLLNVWADDTADVYLDGNLLIPAVFTQSTCSGQPIGCLPADVGVVNTPIAAGAHTLEFKMYQVGTGTNTSSNPFGLLYTGTAPSAVPEPGALGLAGAGLVAIGVWRRKR